MGAAPPLDSEYEPGVLRFEFLPGRGSPLSAVLLPAAMLLFMVLTGWWAYVIVGLSDEVYALTVRLDGLSVNQAQVEAAAQLASRRKMVVWEGLAFALVPVGVVALVWRGQQRERAHQAQLEAMFAASTHELKTPIAGLRALLESLQSGVLPPESAGPYLGQGLEACARLERLVQGVLVRQSVLAGASPVSARPLGERVEAVTQRRAGGAPDRVELGEAAAVEVTVSDDAFAVVLDNLLDNAARYGEGREVSVTARLTPESVVLEVTDRGGGFAPGDAEQLFLPYRRGSRAGTPAGTGLGLFLARTLAQEAGGELVGASAGPGQGATFTWTLPRRP